MLYEYEAWNLEDDQVKEPSLYGIQFTNDDITPIDFVVDLLVKHFEFDALGASHVALDIDENGKALTGCFSLDVAETKLESIKRDIYLSGHPFSCHVAPV